MKTIKDNPIKYSPNLARIVEIALLGKHTVLVAANLEQYPTAKEDYIHIRGLYSGLMGEDVNFGSSSAHICFELVKPDFSNVLSSQYETTKALVDRVLKARDNEDVPEDLCSSSTALLKTAYESLNLGIVDTKHIISVATTIARLEGAKKIEVQHIAEAIQYKAIDLEELTILN